MLFGLFLIMDIKFKKINIIEWVTDYTILAIYIKITVIPFSNKAGHFLVIASHNLTITIGLMKMTLSYTGSTGAGNGPGVVP